MKCYNKIIAGKMFFLLVLFSVTTFTYAQNIIQSTPGEQRMKMYNNHVQLKEQSPFNNFKWQFLGPTNISGRMTDVAVVTPRGKNYTIYVGGATGGVWKTTNDGTKWEPVFENGPSTSIGDIALAPSNQNILWVGTGEANIFRSSNAGAGIFKSEDAGKTFKHMGLVNTGTISRIIVHPDNPDIVYVAASGTEWTNNKDRGVFKTTDGGKTWDRIFYKDEKTGVIDMVIDPKDPNTIYVSTWQRIRQKWNDPRTYADYTGSSIYKTNDAGKNWTEISNGLPEAKFRGRIGIDIAASNTNVLYAFVDNYSIIKENNDPENVDSYGRPKGGTIKGATVYRTDDKGNTWKQVSDNSSFMEGVSATYGWVFGQCRVDPNDENKVYIMGLNLNVSRDGGKTFKEMGEFHVDNHGLWIDPANSNFMVNVNDGGVVLTYDGGENWREFTDNVPVVQFFNIQADMGDPIKVYGSIQDHGSYRGILDLSRGKDKIPAQKFERAPGWEGSIHQIDPTNPDLVYAASFYGSLSRTDMKAGQSKDIMPKAEKGEPSLRGQWLAPHFISPHNTKTLYMGFQYMFKSTDRGDTWTKISPDLTYNNPDKSGDIPYQTIFSAVESPIKPGLLFAGTDDGRVHVTKDDGKNWKEIVKGLPYGKWVSELVASKYDANTVYMAQNGKRDDDFMPYLWKSDDCGDTWKSIVNNLPTGPVNVIKEDPINPDILYVGNDFGVYVSLNKGKKWHSLQANLPTTYVHDLVIHPRENVLIIGTHGRGSWVMDVELLQKLSEEDLANEILFLDASNASLPFNPKSRWSRTEPVKFTFYLKDKSDVTAEVLDASGKTVKDLMLKTEPGFNFASWDMSNNNKEKTLVEPGKYTIKLTLGKTVLTKEITIKKGTPMQPRGDFLEENAERERERERERE
jgi:photosystem II stability/assembly factor-like uncharacterized protein